MALHFSLVWFIGLYIFLLSSSSAPLVRNSEKAIPSISSDSSFRPSKDYLFPIRPGQLNFLSGTMAELRNTHFHGGLDIKTGGIEGLPVFASADGHLSRVQVSTYGYGNVVYLKHPDGNTTVYAHLRDFSDEISDYVRKNQYEKESFDVNLTPEVGELKVSKGDIIGYSGNSGGSGGPHLHYEIRDAHNQVRDPTKFGFSELKDTKAPVFVQVVFSCLDKNARINGTWGRWKSQVLFRNGRYELTTTPQLSGLIGIEVQAFDQMDGTYHRYGIPEIKVKVDNKVVHHQLVDHFSFENTRKILAFMSYESLVFEGMRTYKLFLSQGNDLPFYPSGKDQTSKGILFDPDKKMGVQVEAWDHFGNKSLLFFDNQPNTQYPAAQSFWNKRDAFRVLGSWLIFRVQGLREPFIEAFIKRRRLTLYAEYQEQDWTYFLWDLNQGIPDSLYAGGENYLMDIRTKLPAERKARYFHPDFILSMDENSLFEDCFIRFNKDSTRKGEEIFSFPSINTPIWNPIKIQLRPKNIPSVDKEKISVYRLENNGAKRYEGGTWQGKQIEFQTRLFGNFVLDVDTIPPRIQPITLQRNSLRFIIDDLKSGIKDFELKVNGEWILMNYDYKRKVIWSENHPKSKPYMGEIELKVRDKANNVNHFKTKL